MFGRGLYSPFQTDMVKVKEGENMKKLFVFSDVHGQLSALQTSLKQAGYDRSNPDHLLISLGDLFDRGRESLGVYNFLKERRGIYLKGNHETFLIEALEKGMDGEFVLFNFLHNGLDKTIESFGRSEIGPTTTPSIVDAIIKNVKMANRDLLSWLQAMPIMYETKNYIFVHAGLHPYADVHDPINDEHFVLWDIKYSHYPIESTKKVVVIGHHHAFRVRQRGLDEGFIENPLGLVHTGNQDEHRPVRFGNKIAIDPCSNFTDKVNVIVIEDELLEEAPKTETISAEEASDIFTTNAWQAYTYGPTTTTFTIRH